MYDGQRRHFDLFILGWGAIVDEGVGDVSSYSLLLLLRTNLPITTTDFAFGLANTLPMAYTYLLN
jgi:hypothetical protein